MDKNLIKIVKELADFFGKKLDSVGVELKGVSIVTIKGDKGDTGATGNPGRDGVDGNDSKIPGTKGDIGNPGKDGANGKDSKVPGPAGPKGDSIVGPQGKDGLRGKAGKDGSPDTGEEIVTKINNDKGDHLIRKDKIEGLVGIENMARTADANSRSFMNTGSYVYDYDMSSLLNGVTKTFAIPANAKIIAIMGSSFPTIFRKTIDFTWTASTVTFTSEIDAASTLATGQSVIMLYKIL